MGPEADRGEERPSEGGGRSASMRPYYLLWGFRKCGTTSLAGLMRRLGVGMPDWSESNVWLARPDQLAGALEGLWGTALDRPYLVDLSTLTHLGEADPASMLEPLGFSPHYLVCTRAPGARWVSAWKHMRRKRADRRELREYLRAYEPWVGLSREDLRVAEEELIVRDLEAGSKEAAGLLRPSYFARSYPVAFEVGRVDELYQYRYLGESLDMLEGCPARHVELPLEEPRVTMEWIEGTFGVSADGGERQAPRLNADTPLNALRHDPRVRRVTSWVPGPIRRSARRWIERQRLPLNQPRADVDEGLQSAMDALVQELCGHGDASRSVQG